MWSLSKRFTSTAVGLAVYEGKRKLDDLVLKFFRKEAPERPSDKLKTMRVRALLSMSGRHDIKPKFDIKLRPTIRKILDNPVQHKPGTHFCYNALGSYLLSMVVTKVKGEKVVSTT